MLCTVVVGRAQGFSAAAIGLLLGGFSAACWSARCSRRSRAAALPARVIVVLELWTWTGCGLFVLWPDAIVLVAATLPCALAIPITNSVVFGHGLEITPDRLVGRVESVRSTFAFISLPLGPLVAGALLEARRRASPSACSRPSRSCSRCWGRSARLYARCDSTLSGSDGPPSRLGGR